jgi:regulator of protease activity HflC (stomatin/prohibitin superfamily)
VNAGFWIFLLVLGPVLLFIVWLILLETSVRIEPGTLGLALLRGKSTGKVMGPGRHFMRPWRKVMIQSYPSRELALIAGGLQQSNPDVDYVEEPASVFLGDSSSAQVQYTVRCQLLPGKLQSVHDTYGPEGIWSVLRDVSRQSVISECGSSEMTINDIFGDGYVTLERRIAAGLATSLDEVGFQLKLFSLREVDLGPAGEVVQARIRAGAELEREQALAEVRRARVENDAALLAQHESLDRDQLLRYRQIEAWNDLLEKWNGREHIPTMLTTQAAGWAANTMQAGALQADADVAAVRDELQGDAL